MKNNFLWTFSDLENILQPLELKVEGVLDARLGVTSVAIDSRDVREGTLFFAIKGERNDGHDYLAQAIKSGACAAVVSDDFCHCDEIKIPLFKTSDTYKALLKLAVNGRKRFSGQVVEITGSVGKTTIKEMLAFSLKNDDEKCYFSKKNFNNHFGVPLTLANMPKNLDFAILEAGMSGLNEIEFLTKMINPHISLISTICSNHVSNFSSIMDIARAKAEIFSHHPSEGATLIPKDSAFFDFLKQSAKEFGIEKIYSFGDDSSDDVRLLGLNSEKGVFVLKVDVFGKVIEYKLNTINDSWVANSLAVLGAVHLLGADVEHVSQKLAEFKPIDGRGRQYCCKKFDGASFFVIDESYNASPDSMKAALRSLSNFQSDRRKIAILADMKELGDNSVNMHLDLLPTIDKFNIDVVIACGSCMEKVFLALPNEKKGEWYASSEELLNNFNFNDFIKDRDVIMIKGSHSMNCAKIVERLVN